VCVFRGDSGASDNNRGDQEDRDHWDTHKQNTDNDNDHLGGGGARTASWGDPGDASDADKDDYFRNVSQ